MTERDLPVRQFKFSLRWLPAPLTARQRARFYEGLFWFLVCVITGHTIFAWIASL